MKIIKKSPTDFSEILKSSAQEISHSFFDSAKNIDEDQLKILAKNIGENLTHSFKLVSRKLYVSFSEPNTFEITIKERKNSIPVLYDLYVLQSRTRLYLVVSSKFDVYELLEREPYHESLGEFSYQTQLAKALGLINAVAYNVPRNYELNEKIIHDEDLELMYCSDDNQFFLIYCL